MRRTTRRPLLACFTTTFARAAWVSGWPSWPKPPSTISGPPTLSSTWLPSSSTTTLGSGRPRQERTSSAWEGTSVITTSAARSRSAARTVSSSGSPGPLPTNDTYPAGADGWGAVTSACSAGAGVVLAGFFDTDFAFLVDGLVAAVFVGLLLTVAFLLVVFGRAVMTPAR